jgi:hypothetical protein
MEKALGQVFCLVVVVALMAKIAVDGLPIPLEEQPDQQSVCIRIVRVCIFYEGPMRGPKGPRRTADIGVLVPIHGLCLHDSV